MPRVQSLILLGIAVFLGLLATLAVSFLLDGRGSPQQASADTGRMVVARVPLKFGDQVTPEKLAVIAWPAGNRPEGAASSIAELMRDGAHVALLPISANEPVLLSKLSGGGRGGLSATLDTDKRAATIRIDDVAGVAGFARPGDVVDVLVTRKISDTRQITDVLLQNVQLIALDQQPQQPGTDAPALSKTATLKVSQFEAQQLALGQAAGVLSLMLRNVTDQSAERPRTASLGDLRYGGGAELPRTSGGAMPAAVPAAPGKPAARVARVAFGPAVQVVRGVAASDYQVGVYGQY